MTPTAIAAAAERGEVGATTVLCPPMLTKEERKARNALRDVIRKVVVNAAVHRSREDMLEEVYLAGLWHGVKLSGPQPRKPDYLDLSPPPRRRGRPRKAIAAMQENDNAKS